MKIGSFSQRLTLPDTPKIIFTATMGDAGLPVSVPQTSAVASTEHEELLNVIDQIRLQGISRYMDLPQIIVCGDQSVSADYTATVSR